MKYVIICRVSGAIECAYLPEEHDFRWFAEKIGADIFEAVHPEGLKEPYLFLCDEEGLLKGTPTINFIGSWLYETHKHGQPIVGDIMILKDVMEDGEPVFGGLDAVEAEMMTDWLFEHFRDAHDAVVEKMGNRLIR